MERAEATPRAVVYSALLHLGILAFLALAMLNCTRWETLADALHLPQVWRPVTCQRVMQLQGPIIEATLVGPAGAPPPRAARHARKQSPHHEQKPQPQPKPPPPAPAKVLPPPVPQPKPVDQQKVAQLAQQQAEQAQKLQEEQQQQQRMAELSKQQARERVLKELAQVQAQSAAQQRQINLEQQKAQQLADLTKAAKSQNAQNVPAAKQAMTGQNGTDTAAYQAALTNAIVQNWLRPFDIPAGTVCPVDIKQIRGGKVTAVTVLPSCPLNEVGKASVKMAVERASPLPYKGFQKEFVPDLNLRFVIPASQ